MAVTLYVLRRPQVSGLGTTEPRRVENWEKYAVARNRTGPSDAAVVIVAFEDYQCPVCRALEPHLQAVARQFPQDVALIRRHFPLGQHPVAMPAALAAECAGRQGRFSEFNSALYRDDAWMDVGPAGIAPEVGVPDLEAFNRCIVNGESRPSVESDMSDARALGAPGTPTLIINGVMHVTLVDSLALAAIVREVRGS